MTLNSHKGLILSNIVIVYDPYLKGVTSQSTIKKYISCCSRTELSHLSQDWRGFIVCPVLRAYTCPKCGSTGDYAHTESHCPLSANQPSIMTSLRTRRSSCGMRLKYMRKN